MRAVVIGISGAGKSTFARRLAQGIGAPHVELDALHWDPGWTPAPAPVFAARVAEATAGPAWVVDGNYSAVRDLIWPRATHLVWLDYERLPIMARVVRRSVGRALSGRELWNGNREDWRNWWHASHPIRWAWSQWRGRRQAIEALLAGGAYPGLQVRRLRRPGEAAAVLQALLRDGQG
jgi:adenylate kinase family enzyme